VLWILAVIGFALPIFFGQRVKRRMAMEKELAGLTDD
jgi:hypothetical protein